MTGEPNEDASPKRPHGARLVFLVLVAGALLFAWSLRTMQPPVSPVQERLGQPFPELQVQGWLNGPAPSAADWDGKIRVIEAWAWWCGPCADSAPHLRQLHDRYRGQGVVFVGLTGEDSSTLSRTREFLKEWNITWPNGYGDTTIQALAPNGLPIPHLWILDREGKIAWEGHPAELEPHVMDRLL